MCRLGILWNQWNLKYLNHWNVFQRYNNKVVQYTTCLLFLLYFFVNWEICLFGTWSIDLLVVKRLLAYSSCMLREQINNRYNVTQSISRLNLYCHCKTRVYFMGTETYPCKGFFFLTNLRIRTSHTVIASVWQSLYTRHLILPPLYVRA